jgi:hypothetical protein
MSGAQAFEQIKQKAPELMERVGLSSANLIKKHLVPLLHATDVRIFQKDGEITDFVEVEDNATRLYATRMALELNNAFPPKDQQLAAQLGVKVVVVDIPSPDFSMVNVSPQRRSRTIEQQASDNGSKSKKANGPEEDPRPKD